MSEDIWLLKKRGLYYRPNDCGYTGIRDHAGRYTGDEARARLGAGIAMVRLDAAPEFSEACFDDLARLHLAKQRDEARIAARNFVALLVVNDKGGPVVAIPEQTIPTSVFAALLDAAVPRYFGEG